MCHQGHCFQSASRRRLLFLNFVLEATRHHRLIFFRINVPWSGCVQLFNFLPPPVPHYFPPCIRSSARPSLLVSYETRRQCGVRKEIFILASIHIQYDIYNTILSSWETITKTDMLVAVVMATTNKHIHTYLINEMVAYNIIVIHRKEHVHYKKKCYINKNE